MSTKPEKEPITRDLILLVGRELLAAAGRPPTLEALRAGVAAKTNTKGGSFATLGPIRKELQDEFARGGASATTPREAVPPAITDRLAGLAAELWAVAHETASTRLATERAALSTARDAAEAETAEAYDLAQRMTDERDTAMAEVAQLGSTVAGLRAELVAAAASAQADLRHAREEASNTRVGAERVQGQLAQLRTEYESHQGRLLAAVESATAARADAERIRAELREGAQRERGLIEAAAAAKADAERVHEQLKEQKARSATVITQCETSKQRQEAELVEARKQLRTLDAALGKATGALDALRTQVAGQVDIIKSLSVREPKPPKAGD